jgi:histidine phosphotransferase ChpT
MTEFSLDPLDLAALLASRVCHDVINPVGAIMNGLEVLEDDVDAETLRLALDLIRKSAATAAAQLKFCRLAFGSAGSAGAAIDTGEAETATRALLVNERTTLEWNIARVLMPKNRVKLIVNLCLIAASSIPRGGILVVNAQADDPDFLVKVEARAAQVKLPGHVPQLLGGTADPQTVDARGIQAYYTGLLARAAKLHVHIWATGNCLTLEAAPAPADILA